MSADIPLEPAGHFTVPSAKSRLSRRDLLKGALGMGALLAVSGCAAIKSGRTARDAGAVARENAEAGTRDWMLANTRIDPPTKYRCPWIEGYCSRTSVQPGENMDIFVSANPRSAFTLDIYRMGYYGGSGGRHLMTFGPLPGQVQPESEIGPKRLRECKWESSLRLTIPEDWVSGVYLGKLTALRQELQSYVIFIVKDDRPADFIFQCSDTTWQAYNRWPSQFSLYDDGKKHWYWGGGIDISFDRPYGKYCQILDAPLSTGSGEWFLWEFPIAYWMESRGYDVTYISNLDTHADPANLLRARGFISVGHDEYYSLEMFQHLRHAIAAGLNVAFLSGNTCCGRIRLQPSSDGRPNRIYDRIDVFGPPDPADLKVLPDMTQFPHKSPNANTLIGARSVAPIMGGADFICVKPNHWLFADTRMKHGDRIPGLIGWEWHGDPANIPGLEVLATGPTKNGSGQEGVYTATIYPGPKGNFVFNASTCWWGDGLSEPPGYLRPAAYTNPQGPDSRVQRITANLLERMARG
jgi:hypothetical protein